MKVVIFNCPAGSGKDTIADALCGYYNQDPQTNTPARKFEFKGKLFEIALSTINGIVSEQRWWYLYENHKNEPSEKLGGMSPRNFMINISENFVKPIFGKDVFGVSTLGKLLDWKHQGGEYAFISDGGFKEEIETLLLNPELDVFIVQFTRTVDGVELDFEGDSRDYVNDYPHLTYKLDNNDSTVEEYRDYLIEALEL